MELTLMQLKAVDALFTLITNATVRYQAIKDYTDEQCEVLIEEAIKTTESLDARLEGH